MLMVVDLPEPFGPSRPIVRPGAAVKLRSRSARTPPYDFLRPCAVSICLPPSRNEARSPDRRGRRDGPGPPRRRRPRRHQRGGDERHRDASLASRGKQALQRARQANGAEQTERHAGGRGPRRAADEQADHIALGGADGNPDARFLGAPRRGVGRHGVDAQRRQRQCQCAQRGRRCCRSCAASSRDISEYQASGCHPYSGSPPSRACNSSRRIWATGVPLAARTMT